MPTEAEAVAATIRYQDTLRILRTGLTVLLVNEWRKLGSYDRDRVPEWETRIDPAVTTFAGRTAAVTAAYMSIITDTPVRGVTPPPVLADPEIPFLRTWRGLNQGKPWEEAVAAGESAVAEYSTEVVQYSTADAAEQTSQGTVGWRRVLVGVSCEWCALVSTQRYTSRQSATFGHANCDCEVVPITGSVDPGRVINSQLLREMKAQGVPDRITRNRQSRRSLRAAENAERRRDQVLADLAAETDPTRRMRLETRARRWDNEARAFRARAAEEAARPIQRRVDGTTGYVTPEGQPAPRPSGVEQ